MHEFEIKLVNNVTGAELLLVNPTIHDQTEHDFHEHFEITGFTEVTSATLSVTASDHSGNVTVKTVTLSFKP